MPSELDPAELICRRLPRRRLITRWRVRRALRNHVLKLECGDSYRDGQTVVVPMTAELVKRG